MTTGVELIVARTDMEVDRLAYAWSALPVSYTDAELDYYRALIRTRRDVERPHIVLLRRDGEPAGLVVGRIESVPVVARLGYLAVHRPVLRMLRVSHGGMVDAGDAEVATSLVWAMEDAARAGEADVYLVPAVRLGSPVDRALMEVPSRIRCHPAATTSHYRLVMPPSYDEFLGGRDRKSRYNLRRQASRLEDTFADRLSLEVLDGTDSIDRVFHELGSVAEKTYQRSLGAGFLDTADRRSHVGVSVERGAFRAWLLSIDDRPVAFWQGTARGRTFVLNTAGYAPDFASYGVGAYVQQRMFKDLCDDPAFDVIDFGWGEADYKARFANESWQEHDVMVFAPSVRGLRASVARKGVVGADRAARKLAARAGVAATVKRAWRRRLSRSAAQ
jgi:Acetyltransferase (GNAT) domain